MRWRGTVPDIHTLSESTALMEGRHCQALRSQCAIVARLQSVPLVRTLAVLEPNTPPRTRHMTGTALALHTTPCYEAPLNRNRAIRPHRSLGHGVGRPATSHSAHRASVSKSAGLSAPGNLPNWKIATAFTCNTSNKQVIQLTIPRALRIVFPVLVLVELYRR